jgi:hypothetical protein
MLVFLFLFISIFIFFIFVLILMVKYCLIFNLFISSLLLFRSWSRSRLRYLFLPFMFIFWLRFLFIFRIFFSFSSFFSRILWRIRRGLWILSFFLIFIILFLFSLPLMRLLRWRSHFFLKHIFFYNLYDNNDSIIKLKVFKI